MRKTNLKKLAINAKRAMQVKDRILQKKSFQKKDRERVEAHANLNKKMGYLARASALCAKERYSEAFKVIVEAVDIIKKELEKNSSQQTYQSLRLKTQLGLDREMEITPE